MLSKELQFDSKTKQLSLLVGCSHSEVFLPSDVIYLLLHSFIQTTPHTMLSKGQAGVTPGDYSLNEGLKAVQIREESDSCNVSSQFRRELNMLTDEMILSNYFDN